MYRALAIVFAILSVPVCVAGVLYFESNMEDVFQWLPDSSVEREVYNSFIDDFGADDFVIMSWPDCTLQDQRVDQLSLAIRQNDRQDLVREATSGPELIRNLTENARLERNDVIERFRGFYFGRDSDSQQTCLVVSLTRHGMANRKAAMRYLNNVAADVLGDAVSHLAVAGNPEVGAYGDELIRQTMLWRVGPACLVATIFASFCLRSLRLTIMLLTISALAAVLAVAVVTLSGAKWGGVSAIIPTLAFLMCVSGSLHLVNYARTCPGERLALEILHTGWKPCVFSAGTTVVGMLSLCLSEFPAVRHFGLYCATGVTASLFCQLILVPNGIAFLQRHLGKPVSGILQDRLFAAVLKNRIGLLLACVLLVAICSIGLTQLTANLEVERIFRADTPVMQNIAALEHSLGPVQQTELILTFHEPRDSLFPRRLDLVRQLQTQLREIDGVEGTLSLANSLPSQPAGSGLGNTVARMAYRGFLRRFRERLGETAYLCLAPDRESWRVSIRVPFLKHVDFSRLERDVTMVAAKLIDDAAVKQSVSIRYTGVSHLYHIAQEAVVADLYRNFALAFAVICPLMIIAVRSIPLGLLAMLPNLFPAILVFGGIGLYGYAIDLGIAMTATVALGIAVDDTTHFLLRFQELAGDDQRSLTALKKAFRQCSAAMFFTTAIAGLGLSVFIGGPLAAMTRFAAVLIGLMFVALLCDLLLMPSLLTVFRFVRCEQTEYPPPMAHR